MEVTTQKPAVPDTAEKFIQDVRRKTRRKFTAEEKGAGILQQGCGLSWPRRPD